MGHARGKQATSDVAATLLNMLSATWLFLPSLVFPSHSLSARSVVTFLSSATVKQVGTVDEAHAEMIPSLYSELCSYSGAWDKEMEQLNLFTLLE